MASATNKHRVSSEPSSSQPAKKPRDAKRALSQKKPQQKALSTSHRRSLPPSLSDSLDKEIAEEELDETLRLSSVPSSLFNSSYEETTDEKNDELLSRVQAGVKYVRERDSLAKPIEQTTRFELNLMEASSSTALDLLRIYGTLISESDHLVVYELGIPRPDWVAEGALPGLHDAQWWSDKSAAEVKAGPFVEERDAKRAEANIRGQQKMKSKKKGPTKREKQIDRKLEEELRRQEAGLEMYDDDGIGEGGRVGEESQEKEKDDGGLNVGLEVKVEDEEDEDYGPLSH